MVKAEYDAETDTWLIPLSDAQLDLLSEDWTDPVQLRAVRDDLMDDWHIVVRRIQ